MVTKQPSVISSFVTKAKNYILPPEKDKPINMPNIPYVKNDARYPQYYILPLQLERVSHDIKMWRDAVAQAENAYYPYRYNMQRMFIDTVLDGHTYACIQKRRGLTLLKEFVIQDDKGVINEECTSYFKSRQWFNNLVKYIIDAQFFGYSFVQLGDMYSPRKGVYQFPQLINVKRWNISPDRQLLMQVPIIPVSGINFLDPEVKDDEGRSWYNYSVYVDTPNDIGSSICGFGLLYNTAIYGIILKNNLANNADFNQGYVTPYRHIKTPMSFDEDKRQDLVNSADNMGNAGYIITDDNVNIEFITGNNGTGYQSYENLEKRCQDMITKIFFGHEDIFKTTPGKQTKEDEESPSAQALEDTEKEQDKFVLSFLNDVCLEKFRVLGIPIPDNLRFGIKNNKEEFETRKREDDANKTTAEIAKTMKEAGLEMAADYFEERTKIPTQKIEVQEPSISPIDKKANALAIKNKLDKIYSAHGGH